MSKEFKDTQLPKPPKEGFVPERPRYPSLHLPLKFIPEAKKWSMDKDYDELTLQVKVSSITRSKRKGQDDDTGSIDFDITGIKVDDGAADPKKEKEENSAGSYKERG